MRNSAGASIIMLSILVFGCLGWFIYVYRLTQCDFEAPYKAEAIRTVGIFAAPVGCIVGYIDIEDGKKQHE